MIAERYYMNAIVDGDVTVLSVGERTWHEMLRLHAHSKKMEHRRAMRRKARARRQRRGW